MSQEPRPYQERPPKRRKIQLACRNCRDRKTRCNGGRPICSPCERRGVAATCVYEGTGLNSPRPPSQLRHQLEYSQSENLDLSAPLPDPHRPSTSKNAQITDKEPSIIVSSQQLNQNDPRVVDASATISAVHDNDQSLYGGSSTIALLRRVIHEAEECDLPGSLTGKANPAKFHYLEADTSVSASIPEVIFDRDESAAVFPPRRTADEYMHCFWEFVHPIFPILHRTTFMAKYDALWLSDGGALQPNDADTELDETIFSSTLNLAFALGCQFSQVVAPIRKSLLAEHFYQRHRKLFNFDILDSTSLPMVQMLLLTGVYLQSTKHASRCWNVVGLAIRAAQSLGLHLDQPVTKPDNQLNREMRRRIWWNCVILDRLLAMTFGRPAIISNAGWDVPTPLEIDDEYLQKVGEGTQPAGTTTRMGLFVYSSHLYEVFNDALSTSHCYTGNGDLSKSGTSELRSHLMLDHVLALNRRLDRFVESLPKYLQPNISSDSPLQKNDNYITMQQQIMYCRFLYNRVLLLRPVLLAATEEGCKIATGPSNPAAESTFDSEIVRKACNLCVTTTHRLVGGIFSNLEAAYQISGWHAVYLTFSAATILLAAQKCPMVDIATHKTSSTVCWNRCILILEHYKVQIPSATRAMQILENFRNYIVGPEERRTLDMTTSDENLEASNNDTALQPETSLDAILQMDLSNFNPNGIDSINDAWFSQQLSNLDWLDYPQPS